MGFRRHGGSAPNSPAGETGESLYLPTGAATTPRAQAQAKSTGETADGTGIHSHGITRAAGRENLGIREAKQVNPYSRVDDVFISWLADRSG
jgi:hypothetical protein